MNFGKRRVFFAISALLFQLNQHDDVRVHVGYRPGDGSSEKIRIYFEIS